MDKRVDVKMRKCEYVRIGRCDNTFMYLHLHIHTLVHRLSHG